MYWCRRRRLNRRRSSSLPVVKLEVFCLDSSLVGGSTLSVSSITVGEGSAATTATAATATTHPRIVTLLGCYLLLLLHEIVNRSLLRIFEHSHLLSECKMARRRRGMRSVSKSHLRLHE